MSRKKHLSVAGEDVLAPMSADPMSVFEAAESGTRADELRAMRAVLARAIDSEDTSPRDLAALTRRQLEISREIEALRKQESEAAVEAARGGGTQDERWRPEAI